MSYLNFRFTFVMVNIYGDISKLTNLWLKGCWVFQVQWWLYLQVALYSIEKIDS